MTSNTLNNKRIAKNTILLYVRLILTMAISLYTSRIVLNILGVVDFGIYNAVGGVVGMIAFLNSTMSAATQRFLSYEIGKKDYKQFSKVYSITIQTHLLIAILVVVFAETIGLWFVLNKMNFPIDKMDSVFWVYQFSVFTVAISIIQVPYNASIIAFEKMNIFAYISILDIFLKLLSALLLYYINFDKLVLYSLFIFIASIIIRLLYICYVNKYLKECKFIFCKDIKLGKTILTFAGYNIIAHFSLIARNQGISILLNVFFGPTINAANAVATQVRNAIDYFTQSFIIAVNPQIVKSYATNDVEMMRSLIYKSSKYSFILLIFLAIPLLFEADFIIISWLGNPPKYAILFCRLMIIGSLVDALSGTLVYGALATGNVKKYQFIIGTISLLNLPIAYLMLRIGYKPEVTIIISIVLSFISLFVRLILLHGLIGISMKIYMNRVILHSIIIFIISSIFPMLVVSNLDSNILRLLLTITSSSISIIILSYYIAFNYDERSMIKRKIKSLFFNKSIIK